MLAWFCFCFGGCGLCTCFCALFVCWSCVWFWMFSACPFAGFLIDCFLLMQHPSCCLSYKYIYDFAFQKKKALNFLFFSFQPFFYKYLCKRVFFFVLLQLLFLSSSFIEEDYRRVEFEKYNVVIVWILCQRFWLPGS